MGKHLFDLGKGPDTTLGTAESGTGDIKEGETRLMVHSEMKHWP